MWALLSFIGVVVGVAYYFKEYMPFFKYQHVQGLENVTDAFIKDFKTGDVDKDGKRKDKYTKTTETFYNLITDFYEYGWGQSFHFAPRWQSETFEQSIYRYEHWVAAKLELKPTMKVLDVGCGIGGPMRAVSRFSQANIVGVNITQEHIERATRYNAKAGIKKCEFIRSDFNSIPVADQTFDAIYDFEATLHSTDRKKTFTELNRVLKKGGKIVTLQYCLLSAYDDKNATHRDIIRRVDNTNGCYCAGNTVATTNKAFEEAGFKILESFDAFETLGDVPFHQVFTSVSGGRFAGTKVGRMFTKGFVWLGEKLMLMPKGTYEVQEMLVGAADSFTEAGNAKLLTPGYVYVLQKI